MPKIFISYRRSDSNVEAHHLHERLAKAFGRQNVFIDVDNIRPGTDFMAEIERFLISNCDVMIVVIGQTWLHTTDSEGQQRIFQPADFVRHEIEIGLRHSRQIELIPVLLDQATMPSMDELPHSIALLAGRNAALLRPDTFDTDSRALIQTIRQQFPTRRPNLLTLLASVLGLAVIVGLALLLSGYFEDSGEDDPPRTTQDSALLVDENATQSATEAPADVPTEAATELSAPLEVATDPALEAAFQRVENNSAWQAEIRDIDGVSMALVPVGCFRMGSDTGNEAPPHQICIDNPFWIDVFEVSNGDFGSAGEAEACQQLSTEGAQPRVCVDWFEAKAYCEARGARLPTEAEWEYAARGPDGLIYPWGSDFVAENAISRENFGSSLSRGAAQSGVSWVGAQDMAGNVYEWTSSAYRAYPYDAVVSETSSEDASLRRVLRGGAYLSSAYGVQATFRAWLEPALSTASVGFRCVRAIE